MKIGTKLGLIIIIFIFVSFVTITGILNTVTESNFRQVEIDVHEDTMENMYEILIADFEFLELLLDDWAQWDATLDFIKGNYPEYLEENIPELTYDNYNFHLIIISDEDNNIVYNKELFEEASMMKDIDLELSNILLSYEETTGIIEYKGEYIIFSNMYITDTNADYISTGKMVHAYRITEDYLDNLNDKISQEMILTLENESSILSSDYVSVISKDESDYGVSTNIVNQNNKWFGKIDFPIVNSSNSALFTIELDKNIYELGQSQKRETSIMVLLSLMILMVIMSIAIRIIIILRVEKLNKEVDAITISGSVKDRVDIKGQDELGKLSDGINLMLNEIEEMHLEVTHLASYDILTGTYNRRHGYELLTETVESHKKSEILLSVIFIDINNLKVVNDKLGHNYGDELIVDMVNLLNENIVEDSYIIRFGGDEFLYVLPGKSKEESLKLINNMIQNKDINAFNKTKKYELSFSYGVTTLNNEMSVDDLVEEADRLMYIDKKEYKDRMNKNKK